jgi:hypothetical protein
VFHHHDGSDHNPNGEVRIMATIENIVRLPPRKTTTRKFAKATTISDRKARRIRLQHGTAALIGCVAAAMTTVSLSHIAGGVEHITHGAIPHWQAWGVAVGLDVNYVGMEMAAVVAAYNHVRKRLHRLTRFGIPAVMGFSMSLNALEFAAGATNTYELAAGIAMGVVLPGLVWLAFRVASVLADV